MEVVARAVARLHVSLDRAFASRIVPRTVAAMTAVAVAAAAAAQIRTV